MSYSIERGGRRLKRRMDEIAFAICDNDRDYEDAMAVVQTAEKRYEQLKSSLNTLLRHEGIYEAHLRGIRAEEIAGYGDYRVEFVEDCIRMGELHDYSYRTGNAIIWKYPGED